MKHLLLLFLTIGIIALPGCHQKQFQPYSDGELLLGTFVRITIYDSTSNRDLMAQATDSAFRRIQRIEAHTNPFNAGSEIARMNASIRANQPIEVSPVLLPILRRAREIASETGGAYDPTLWPVFRLWHFGTDSARVPDRSQILRNLSRVNYRNFRVDSGKVVFSVDSMGLDLSGISKGYAVEQARQVLKDFGFRNFIIDAGGNLGIEWHRWDSITVYIRHPRREGEFLGTFPVAHSCGVATSGDYQDYFFQDSVRYHHILNPRTGYPARGVVSVTVLAPEATTADGLSTALFVMGKERGMAFLWQHPELEAVFVTLRESGLHVSTSPGLAKRFHRLTQNQQTVE
jgi:thiamine biosynthesis lipoprotein